MTARLDLELAADPSALARLATTLETFGEANDLPTQAVLHLNLCLDELITNIISYAYEAPAGHRIQLDLVLEGGLLRGELTDDGRPFNPLQAPAPDLDADLDQRRIGGLGIHFVKTLMDHVDYRRQAGLNRVTFQKRLSG